MRTAGPAAGEEVLEAILVEVPDRRRRPVRLVVIAAIVVVGAAWLWTRVLFPSGASAVDRFVDEGQGVAYQSRRDGFRAAFPTEPQRRALIGDAGPGAVVESRPDRNWAFRVTWQAQGEAFAEDAAGTLEQVTDELARRERARIEVETIPFASDTLVVKDALLRGEDRWLWTRFQLTARRLYTLQVSSPHRSDRTYERFGSTFALLAPPGDRG
jgi:hypothetical protein